MTTTPVMTITDEQIAEIEGYCAGKHAEGFSMAHNLALVDILALISRLRAAEKDAERYRWIRDTHNIGGCVTVMSDYDRTVDQVFGFEHGNFDSAIDAAMEQSE